MAPRTRAAALICKSCRTSLTRSFSSAVPRQHSRAFPEFTPTSQPELDAILSKYREEVFVPESLSTPHKRLMYRPTKHHILNSDAGVTVSVSDEEEVKLEPKFMKDRPKKRKTMAAIAELLGQDHTPEAWSNLKPFLEGLKTSHWPLPPYFLEQVTRKADKVGMQRILIECAEQASKTDARLSDPFFTRELLHGCHFRAIQSSFKGEEFDKAARQAQHIILLLDRNDHCGSKQSTLPPGHYDMRRSLFVNSIHLEMTASRILASSQSPTDITGEVGRGVARVLALSLPAEPGLADFTMPEFTGKQPGGVAPKEGNSLGHTAQRLENLLPVWSGLKFAGKIPSAVMASNKNEFGAKLSQVTEEIQRLESKIKETAGGNLDRRALNLLKQLRSIHG